MNESIVKADQIGRLRYTSEQKQTVVDAYLHLHRHHHKLRGKEQRFQLPHAFDAALPGQVDVHHYHVSRVSWQIL
ncbi:MAG: hypothetical protein WCH40_06615 [Verrucomicrobiales bacterium]